MCPQKDLHKNVLWSYIHDNKIIETIQISINGIDKSWYIYKINYLDVKKNELMIHAIR